MIPLYVQSTIGGVQGLPRKNPIYFIKHSVARDHADPWVVTILNLPDGLDTSDYRPDGLAAEIQGSTESYDVEVVAVTPQWNEQVEPYPDRSGSLAGEPERVQTLVALRGHIRGTSLESATSAAKLLNERFDPVIDYLSGSSTFEISTVSPNWQPFFNVGYGVVAWFDPSSKDDWRVLPDWVDDVTDPFTLEEFARPNRMMLVRSIAKPVPLYSKFDDFNVPFIIQLQAVDPNVYEYIAPSSWWGAGQTEQLFIDKLSTNVLLESSGGAIQLSNESLVVPTYPWGHEGPGWREVDTGLDLCVVDASLLDQIATPNSNFELGDLTNWTFEPGLGAWGVETPGANGTTYAGQLNGGGNARYTGLTGVTFYAGQRYMFRIYARDANPNTWLNIANGDFSVQLVQDQWSIGSGSTYTQFCFTWIPTETVVGIIPWTGASSLDNWKFDELEVFRG